jgi:hypothetical protein
MSERDGVFVDAPRAVLEPSANVRHGQDEDQSVRGAKENHCNVNIVK